MVCLICVSAISTKTIANQENSKSVFQNSNKEKLQSIRACIRIHTRVICSVMFRSTGELEEKLSKISTNNIDVMNIKTSFFITFNPAHLQKSNKQKSIQKSIQQKLSGKKTLNKRKYIRRIQVPLFSTKSFFKSQNKSILLSSTSEKMTKATTNSSVCNLCKTSMYLLALFLIFFI